MPSASSDLPPGGLEQKPDDARMRNARVLARAALIWERLWPLALPLVLLIAVFLSVSWLGLWPLMQNGLRLALLGLFAVWPLWWPCCRFSNCAGRAMPRSITALNACPVWTIVRVTAQHEHKQAPADG